MEAVNRQLIGSGHSARKTFCITHHMIKSLVSYSMEAVNRQLIGSGSTAALGRRAV